VQASCTSDVPSATRLDASFGSRPRSDWTVRTSPARTASLSSLTTAIMPVLAAWGDGEAAG
jgi:hypothetical protein